MGEPWELPDPRLWLPATVLASRFFGQQEPWLRLDGGARRTLKDLLQHVPLSGGGDRREAMDLLADTFLNSSTDEQLARVPGLNPPKGRNEQEQRSQALKNLARIRRALDQLLDACKELDGLSLAALEKVIGVVEPGRGVGKSLPEEAVKLSRVERTAQRFVLAHGHPELPPEHDLSLSLAPPERNRVALLAAKRLAWLWWRATGKPPTCPRRKVEVTEWLESQEYYGPYIELVRGFFSIVGLDKPDSNADQAVRWLPSVIANVPGDPA
jgi:hypothetical protein